MFSIEVNNPIFKRASEEALYTSFQVVEGMIYNNSSIENSHLKSLFDSTYENTFLFCFNNSMLRPKSKINFKIDVGLFSVNQSLDAEEMETYEGDFPRTFGRVVNFYFEDYLRKGGSSNAFEFAKSLDLPKKHGELMGYYLPFSLSDKQKVVKGDPVRLYDHKTNKYLHHLEEIRKSPKSVSRKHYTEVMNIGKEFCFETPRDLELALLESVGDRGNYEDISTFMECASDEFLRGMSTNFIDRCDSLKAEHKQRIEDMKKEEEWKKTQTEIEKMRQKIADVVEEHSKITSIHSREELARIEEVAILARNIHYNPKGLNRLRRLADRTSFN